MKQLFIFAMSSVLFISCKNSSESNSLTSSNGTEEIQNVEVSNKLQLNNNEKWTVNEEMKPHIIQGEELLVTYTATKDTDYVTLAEKLTELNNNLIKSCTMEGASHDELHKWLHPHLEMVAALKTTTDQEKVTKSIANITNSYKTYHTYFN